MDPDVVSLVVVIALELVEVVSSESLLVLVLVLVSVEMVVLSAVVDASEYVYESVYEYV